MDMDDMLGFGLGMAYGASASSGSTSPAPVTRIGGLEDVELRLDRQHLVIQTLLRLLIEKGVIQESEFKQWMDYVDGFDGQRDGRLRKDNVPRVCGSCGRKSGKTAARCMFCGQEFSVEFLARDRSKE